MVNFVKLIFLSLPLVFAVACGTKEDVAEPESIQNVRAQHETQLMAMPGVVSVGIGQNSSGQPVIIIGVESQDELDKITIPKELNGYPIQVQIMGTIGAQ